MAPVAYAEASTCNEKGQLRSGCESLGPFVTAVMRISSASQHSFVHLKG